MPGERNAALGREHLNSSVEISLADIPVGLIESVFTALVCWIRLMHIHYFQELTDQSLLLVAVLCHVDAVRQLAIAVWHMLVMWERECHCGWLGTLAGVGTWLW